MQLGSFLVAKQLLSSEQKLNLDRRLQEPRRGGGGICPIIRDLAGDETAERCERAARGRLQLLVDEDFKEALRAAYEGKAILFVGAGFSGGLDDSSFSGDDLRSHLVKNLIRRHKKRFDLAELERLPLQDIAQIFIRINEEDDLRRCVEHFCEQRLRDRPQVQHDLLAGLDCFRFIFTTNWDCLIEKAFGDGRCHVVRHSEDVTRLRYDVPNVVKLHGEFDHAGGQFVALPRIAASQIASLAREEPAIYNLLRALFYAHDVIVIGFRPNDYNFAHLLRDVARDLPKNKSVYVVDPSPGVQHLLTWGKVKHLRCQAIDFLDGLESYIESDGGTRGRWRRGIRRPGAIAIHSKEACRKAVELGRLLETVQQVEVSTMPRRRSLGMPAKQRLGRIAASLLRQIVEPGQSIVFSCGSTLEALAEEADGSWGNFARTRLYSASVPITHESTSSAPISLAALFAKRLASLDVRCRSYQLPLDFLGDVADPRFEPYLPKVRFNLDPHNPARRAIEEYLEEAGKSQVFVLGIGATAEGAESGLRRYLESCLECTDGHDPARGEARILKYLRKIHDDKHLNYVGDVMYWLFKSLRQPTPTEQAIHECFIDAERLIKCFGQKGIHVTFREFLVRAYCHVRSLSPAVVAKAAREPGRTVIGVAAGRRKAEAVVSACFAGLFNVLMVDEELCDGMIAHIKGLG